MADWIITTVIGTGEKGCAGDGGPATAALLNGPFDIAFDVGGNLFSRTRSISGSAASTQRAASSPPSPAMVSRVTVGDGGPAIAASLNEPYGIVLDRTGNLFIADRLNRRVRRVDAATGIITTFAGTVEAAL